MARDGSWGYFAIGSLPWKFFCTSEMECSNLSDVASYYKIALLNSLLGTSVEVHFDIKWSVKIQMFKSKWCGFVLYNN